MDILCIIPARGGSKGLKNKNIKPFMGKPLIAYTIEAAFQSSLVNKIAVSTDDAKIARVARQCGAMVIQRPKRYATDKAPIELALRHAVRHLQKTENYSPEIIVWLQANIPIRKKGQIDKVIMKLIRSKAESAVTVSSVEQFPQWMKKMDKRGFLYPLVANSKQYRRQDVRPLYRLDGSIVAMKTQTLMGTKHLRGVHVYLGKKIMGIVQEKKYSIEIDSQDDFKIAELYFKVS
jgi:N-acylneuraminate cytidylyltransferase/CMP-N,N'-diacetyllegionaminic acid synthase